MPHSLGWREMSALQGAQHLLAELSRKVSRPETCPAHCLCRLAGTLLRPAAEGFLQACWSPRTHKHRLYRWLPGHTAQPPPPISTDLFASNHRSGRAGVGGKRSRCSLAAIFLEAASFYHCYSSFRREGRTTGAAASILRHLSVVTMVRRKRKAGVSEERESKERGRATSLVGPWGVGSRVSHSSA